MRQDYIFFGVIAIVIIYVAFFMSQSHILYIRYCYNYIRGYIRNFAGRISRAVDASFGMKDEF